ncbi:MAG: hypothetical protein K2Q45_06580 [Nitrosomonas sp.]|nr:hypothetical protein [Nitrosomonas sp.]
MARAFTHTNEAKLALAIFTSNLCASRDLLCKHFFTHYISPTLFACILKRGDTSLEYVRQVALDIENGNCTQLTHEGLVSMLSDMTTPSLKAFLTKTSSEVKRDNAGENYRLLSEEQKQLKQLDSARLMSILQEFGEESDVGMEEDEENNLDLEANVVTTAADEALPPPQAAAAAAANNFLWTPAFFANAPPPPMTMQYSWFWTIFYRVNAAHLLPLPSKDKVLQEKVELFKNAHLKCVQYLDSLADPCNTNIDEAVLLFQYKRLGSSHYECDRSLIKVHREEHVLRKTPLQIICAAYPDKLYWTPEQFAQAIRSKDQTVMATLSPWVDDEWNPFGTNGVPAVETHTLYYGIVCTLRQIRDCLLSYDCVSEVRDALWHYYCSFVDFFHHMAHKPMHDFYLLTPMDSEMSRDGVTVLNSEKATPWALYGTCDTRAFTAHNLPDFYHVLASIPLAGEQKTPSYFLGKIYQKSLPFACQRRHLIKLVVRCVNQDAHFARILCQLAWVMLANLYPGDLYNEEAPLLKMRDLLRIKELTANKDVLLSVLNTPVSDNGGPLVVLTIFRMHILYMASFNEQYVTQAKRCIEWDSYYRDVLKLRNIVCAFSLFPQDPFAQARKELGKTVKSPHSKVHRLRRKSVAVSLMEFFNETLEKIILKDKQNFTLDFVKLSAADIVCDAAEKLKVLETTIIGRHLLQEDPQNATLENAIEITKSAKVYYDNLLSFNCKSQILNELLNVPANQRLSQNAFCMLLNPRFGGVSQECVHIMCDLVNVYKTKPVPKELKSRIGRLRMVDVVAVCFYLNMVAQLERISFVPLPAEIVRQTDEAMTTKRYHLYPGQSVPDTMYNVSVALCCEKICTLMGNGKNGERKVAYNLEKQMFVCAHGKSLKPGRGGGGGRDSDDENDADDLDQANELLNAEMEQEQEADAHEERVLMREGFDMMDLIGDATAKRGKGTERMRIVQDRKAVRNERKLYNKIPCGQPVLTFSLRGRALIWGTTFENKTKVMHCPRCASLHVYTVLNFSGGNGEYRCSECARKETMHISYYSCCYCGRSTASQINESTRLEVLCTNDEHAVSGNEPELVVQNLYFCKAHFRIARRFNYARGGVVKEDLFKLIKHVQEQKQMQYARGIYHK